MNAPYPPKPSYSPDPSYPPESRTAVTAGRHTGRENTSVGKVIGDISEDLSRLFRQEVELAKVELRQEAGKAGKAAGMLGAAALAGFITVLLLSLAVVFGLGNVMDLGWAALIVAAAWAIAGAVLFGYGRSKLRTVSPVPRQTVETLKEDAQWLRHPTR